MLRTKITKIPASLQFVALCIFSLPLSAQTAMNTPSPNCPTGYQPYATRCVSQRMADYISCIEATGGNREAIVEDIAKTGDASVAAGAKVNAKAPVAKGDATLTLNRKSERALQVRLEKRWFPGGGSECARALDGPPKKTLPPSKPNSGLDILQEAPNVAAWWRSVKEPATFLQPGPDITPDDESRYKTLVRFATLLRNRQNYYVAIKQVDLVVERVDALGTMDTSTSEVRNAILRVQMANPRATVEEATGSLTAFGLGTAAIQKGFEDVEIWGYYFQPPTVSFSMLQGLRGAATVKSVRLWAGQDTFPFSPQSKIVELRQPVPNQPGRVSQTLDAGIPAGATFALALDFSFANPGRYVLWIEVASDSGIVKTSRIRYDVRAV